MGKVRFSNMAVEDLTAIWNYTEEKWSEQQADSYYEQLIAASRRIANEPFLPGSKKYDHIEAGLCGFKIHKHILFYRVIDEQSIFIVRILHERMDINNRLVESTVE